MKPSILAYLQSQGVELIPDGQRWMCKSPLKPLQGSGEDRTPSFVIYPDGGFKCWSTGEWGDVYKLQRLIGGTLDGLPDYTPVLNVRRQDHWGDTVPAKYTDITEAERITINTYAMSRKITEGFIPGCYYKARPKGYDKKLAMMFVHKDLSGRICGAKFRNVAPEPGERRFVMRGRPGFYVLDTGLPGPRYLIESETSANSLWMILRSRGSGGVVISHGSVENVPKTLPLGDIPGYLILDYDGNEELYQKRVRKYNHLNLDEIKLRLDKAEDVNSLYCQGKPIAL